MRQPLEVNYDTHQEVKNIQGAGFDIKQAEVIVKSINASRNNDISKLATKEQIFVLEKTMDVMSGDITSLKVDAKSLQKDVKSLEINMITMAGDINSLRNDVRALDEKFTGQIKALDEKFTAKFIELEAKIDLKIENLGNKLTAEFKDFGQVVLRWLAGLFIAALGILATLAFRFFIH